MPKSSVEHIETDRKGPTVFVWDLDETLIIFQTLLDGRYVELFDGFKDTHKATLLGRRWETLILEVCDDYFFYNHVSSAPFLQKHGEYSSIILNQLVSQERFVREGHYKTRAFHPEFNFNVKQDKLNF